MVLFLGKATNDICVQEFEVKIKINVGQDEQKSDGQKVTSCKDKYFLPLSFFPFLFSSNILWIVATQWTMSFKLLMIIFQIDSVYVGTSNILKTEEAQWQTSLKRSI